MSDEYNFVMPGLSIRDMRPAEEIAEIWRQSGFTVDEFINGVAALGSAMPNIDGLMEGRDDE